MLTAAERQWLKRAVSDMVVAQAEAELRAQRQRLCSRCRAPVEPEDLCAGRYWCRPCEARRRAGYRLRARGVTPSSAPRGTVKATTPRETT